MWVRVGRLTGKNKLGSRLMDCVAYFFFQKSYMWAVARSEDENPVIHLWTSVRSFKRTYYEQILDTTLMKKPNKRFCLLSILTRSPEIWFVYAFQSFWKFKSVSSDRWVPWGSDHSAGYLAANFRLPVAVTSPAFLSQISKRYPAICLKTIVYWIGW